MKKKLVIVKLGGSVITDKSQNKSVFQKETVARLIREIIQAKKHQDFDLILVHGAGAYAHFLTTKYKINQGFQGQQSAQGFAKIKKELFRLNNLVWDACLKAGLLVCTVQPSAVIFTKNGQIKHFNTTLVESLLKWGISPLLMGDDTVDEIRGMAVLSGDKTLTYLARKLAATKVIFISDVQGIYDKNPKVYKDARLISQIDGKNFQSTIESMEVFNKNDASGEMKGKLLAIKNELSGIDIQIISGLVKYALKKSLAGEQIGTSIAF